MERTERVAPPLRHGKRPQFLFLSGYKIMIENGRKTALVHSPIDINNRSHRTAKAQGKTMCGNEP
jgi:hypothetical protein